MAFHEPFLSLSRIRLLLVPVGSVEPDSFREWTQCLKSIDRIPLCDIPEDRAGRTRFMPTRLATGHLLLTYEDFNPGNQARISSLARLSQWPMGVVGIAQASSATQLATLGADFKAELEEILPLDTFPPLATHCLAFQDANSRFNLDTKDAFSGLVVIPHDMGNKQLYLATLLAELCSTILAGFSDIATALESERGNEALNARLFPLNTDLNRQPEPSPPLQSELGLTRTLSPPGYQTSSSQNTSPEPGLVDRRRSSTKALSSNRQRTSGTSTVHFHARLYRLLADLYLMSGRVADASIWYNQAIESFKANGDNTWHAGALEGLCACLVLDAWMTVTATSENPKSDTYADLWSKLTIAISLYGRLESLGSVTTSREENSQASLLYGECVHRQAKLALAVWLSEGWNSETLELLVGGIPSTLGPFSVATRISFTEKSGLSGSYISGILAQAHGPYMLHLEPQDQLTLLSTQASAYTILGFSRKAAFISREILGVLLDLLACSRNRDHQSGEDESPTPNFERNSSNRRPVESREGNASVVSLITRIGEAYGVNFSYLPILESHSYQIDQIAEETKSTGWPELQLGLVREVMAIAEALPEHLSVAQFALSALWKMHQFLDVDDQHFLYSTALRVLAIARRRGDNRLLGFWLNCTLLDITVVPSPTMLVALPSPKGSGANTESAGPFLYNPNQLSQSKKLLLVQREPTEFHLTFWNPYSIPVECPSITLSSSGAQFQSNSIRVILPPQGYHTVRYKGIPVDPGSLTVRGCFIRLPGSPITEIFARPAASKRLSAVPPKSQRISSDETEPFEAQSLECEVAPAQPLLRVKATSLTHGAAMLYDGEVRSLRFTLENISDIAVGFMQLIFNDTIQEAAEQELLSEGLVSEIEAYELGHELRLRPVFMESLPGSELKLEPGEMKSITVSCLGKIGCNFGSIQIIYGRIPKEDHAFYTRRLEIPILMTVYRALELTSFQVIPYSTALLSETSQALSIPKGQHPHEWCLLVLQVENSHTIPFQLIVEHLQDNEPLHCHKAIISPGSNSSVILPIKRIWLSEEQCTAPVPAPTGRQFILRSPNTSKGDDCDRELFWYRERLFASLRARWQDLSEERSGELVMRHRQLTREMLSTLKLEDTRIRLWILARPDETHLEEPERHAQVSVNQFWYLKTRVNHRTDSHTRPLVLSLSVDLTDFVLLEGSSDSTDFQLSQSSKAWEAQRAVCFISSGRFRFTAIVRDKVTGKVVNQAILMVNAQEEFSETSSVRT